MHREIMIVRHGEAYNTIQPDDRREVRDTSNPPLTPLGEAQAACTADVVREFAPQHVIVSPFLRAGQTALAYLQSAKSVGGFDVRMSEFFTYASLEPFSGVDAKYYDKLFGANLPVQEELTQRGNYPSFPESVKTLKSRVSELGSQWTQQSGWERIVFYGHGATVLGLIEELVPSLVGTIPDPRHCSVTKLVETANGTWDPALLTDVEHLTKVSEFLTSSAGAADA